MQTPPTKPSQGGNWGAYGDVLHANHVELAQDFPTARSDVAALKTRVTAVEALGPGAVVVIHGSNPNMARPANTTLVIWEGSVAPNNAAGTDFWRVP